MYYPDDLVERMVDDTNLVMLYAKVKLNPTVDTSRELSNNFEVEIIMQDGDGPPGEVDGEIEFPELNEMTIPLCIVRKQGEAYDVEHLSDFSAFVSGNEIGLAADPDEDTDNSDETVVFSI